MARLCKPFVWTEERKSALIFIPPGHKKKTSIAFSTKGHALLFLSKIWKAKLRYLFTCFLFLPFYPTYFGLKKIVLVSNSLEIANNMLES